MSKVVISSLFIVGSLLFATGAYAVSPNPSAPLIQAPGSAINPDTNIQALPTAFVNLLFAVAIMLAVVYLIFGGIRWITSRGDKVGVEAARKHIVAAIIGLVVVAGTFFIIQVIFQFLGASNPLESGFTLPTLASPNPS